MSFQLAKIFISILFALLCVIANTAHADIEQDRAEGITWLLQNQNGDGSWGHGGAKVAATAEALEALRNSGVDYGFIYSRALSWLANVRTDSVDSLSRKIIALEHAGIDTFEIGLIDVLQAYRNTEYAWGAFDGYRGGFPDTSLAMDAIRASGRADGVSFPDIGLSLGFIATSKLEGNNGWSYIGGSGGASSRQQVIPTAQNIRTLSEYKKIGWDVESHIPGAINYLINSKKEANGSFLDDADIDTGAIYKTALAYLAIDSARSAGIEPAGSAESLTSAQAFILIQQSTNGSWNNDPYQTALALQTLPSATLSDLDGDGIPDAVEWQIDSINGDVDARNLIPGNGLSNNLTAQGFIAEVLEQHALPNVSTVSGGTPPYTWSLASGALPPGVTSINSDGVFIGVPTTAGIYQFTLSAQDSAFVKAVIPGFVKVIAEADSVTDTDNDGIPDSYELDYTFLNPLDPSDANQDQNNDGQTNLQEYQAGIDPANMDTDGDGLTDQFELDNGLDPAKSDTDGDGLPDKYELDNGLDPTKSDTDRDGLDDGWEIDNNLDPLDGLCPSYICGGLGSWHHAIPLID